MGFLLILLSQYLGLGYGWYQWYLLEREINNHLRHQTNSVETWATVYIVATGNDRLQVNPDLSVTNYKLLENVQVHLLSSLKFNFDRKILCLEYFFLLLKHMTDSLMTLAKDEVVEFMDEFFINQEDFELLMIVSKFQGQNIFKKNAFALKWVILSAVVLTGLYNVLYVAFVNRKETASRKLLSRKLL